LRGEGAAVHGGSIRQVNKVAGPPQLSSSQPARPLLCLHILSSQKMPNEEAIHNRTVQSETERRGRVVNTPPSYLGGPGLKSRSGDRLP
jgi:hypothetical protein